VVRIAGPHQPYDPTYHLLGRIDKVRARIRQEAPDVLEAHSPYLATAAIVASGPRAARLHTAFWHSDHLGTYVEPQLAKHLGRPVTRAISGALWRGVRFLLHPFDATFVAGRKQAARLREAGVKRVLHVPFGVDVETFRPEQRSEDERRRWLGSEPDGTALLVAVGRLAVEKRWDVVLQAFGRIRQRRRAVLLVIGDGPERARLEALAPPGVAFAGFMTDRTALARVLASADALVHGCPTETFGLGVAEGVACGLPVIVPDDGDAADSADPSCSETYASLDPVACAAALDRVLDHEPRQLRVRAVAAATRVPTAKTHFTRVVSFYEELLREAASRR
jgi:alpha-1,6-mannosyltransferase